MKCTVWTILMVSLVACCAALAADGNPAQAPRITEGWTLTTGDEFPGAQGALSQIESPTGPSHGKIYKLSADFRGGGGYVGMLKGVDPMLAVNKWRFQVKTPAQYIAVRVTDATDQNHQRYLRVDAAGKWAEVVVADFDTKTEGSHWGGPNDGVFRPPVKRFGIMIQRDSGAPPLSETLIGDISVDGRPVLSDMTSEAYFVQPDTKVAMHWLLPVATGTRSVNYTVLAYDGSTEAAGEAAIDPVTGAAVLERAFSRGYHQIEFPSLQRSFGVVAQPAITGQVDPFFCIDASLSILEERQEPRDALINVLRRCGIAMGREHLYWTRVNAVKDKWNWQVYGDEPLHQRYKQAGVKILEQWHDVADWVSRWPNSAGPQGNPYPRDMHAVAGLWAPVAKHWSDVWGAAEIWNEPEGDFGGYLPGDQVAALTKVVSYTFAANNVATPIVGGVLAGSFPEYDLLSVYVDNGLIEDCDAFSFHNYGPPVMVEKQVAGLRWLMKNRPNGSLPFWITESGRAWKSGPPRAGLDEDRFSALEVTMKGVEAKACGVACYFPFVYAYYVEGSVNWGMMGKERSPMRSMAAYVNSVGQLQGMQYAGDLADVPSDIMRARVFADSSGDNAVVVLYTGKTEKVQIPAFSFNVREMTGIDGRAVSRENGRVTIDGGMLYVRCKLSDLRGRLTTNTTAMKLTQIARRHVPQPRQAKAVVLQPDPSVLPHTNKGYRVTDASAVELIVLAHNLAEKPAELALSLQLPPGVRVLKAPDSKSLAVPGMSVGTVRYTLDMSAAFKGRDIARVGVVDGNNTATPISVSFVKRSEPTPTRVPLWTSQADQNPATVDAALAETGWIDFGDKANWIGWSDLDDGQAPIKGRLQISWSPDALHMQVLIEDKSFHQPYTGGDMWLGDSLQIDFQNRPEGKIGGGFTEITAALSTAGPVLWRNNGEKTGPVGPLAKSRLRCLRQGDYLLYLITLDAGEVELSLASGNQVGLSVLVNNNDGAGRLGWLEWGGGIGSAKVPSEYKLLLLNGT